MREDTFSADLFVAEMTFKRCLNRPLIEKLEEEGLLLQIRDLAYKNDLIKNYLSKVITESSQKDRYAPLFEYSTRRDQYKRQSEEYMKKGLFSVSVDDSEYPETFRSLSGMPRVLFCKGDIRQLNIRTGSIAVVGSREPSQYGIQATEVLTGAWADAGVQIISGLARGVDTIAHRMTLMNHAKTIAVLACGPDLVYPRENRAVYEQICAEGLVISEMLPGQKAIRQYFPARNRIMSALSDVVVVIQAGEFSGTLHTASFAAAQGRDVFVVPSQIFDSGYKGNLSLLRDGAEILVEPSDVLARLSGVAMAREYDEIRRRLEKDELRNLLDTHPEKVQHADLVEMIKFGIGEASCTADELSEITQIPFHKMAPILSELLLAGVITEYQNRFSLTIARCSSI